MEISLWQAKQEAAADILRRFGRIDLNAQSICFCLAEIYSDYGLCTDKYGHCCTPLDLQYGVEQTVFRPHRAFTNDVPQKRGYI